MSNQVDQLLNQPVSFLSDSCPDENIAICTRIRLARNLEGFPFPAALSLSRKKDICDAIYVVATSTDAMGGVMCLTFDPSNMSELDRMILKERRLASIQLLENPKGARLLVHPNESSSIMVNEEDQIRIQNIQPGLQLEKAWEEIDKLDNEIGKKYKYAFSNKLGFLTSCPTNVGTGMRASVMLHLPGLVMTQMIESTIRGVNKLNLAVRGIFGEGTDNQGNLFQVSNQSTLGESEQQILDRLKPVILELISQEKRARQYLLEKDQIAIYDLIGRAYGTLLHAYRLNTKEALQLLSGMRLGADLKLFKKDVTIGLVNSLFLSIHPGHLQKIVGRELKSSERDVCRATLCREKLKEVSP